METLISSGRLRGLGNGKLNTFKGIPYAQAPVGALRFRAPRPVAPWQGTRDAIDFGASAIQTVGGPVSWIYPQPTHMDEDCLSLNVWAPASASSLPVVVWIHGGGYRTGSSSMPVFDGSRFAELGNVVVVTINYRLGVIGWAAHPTFEDEQNGACANWAVQDQIAALRWVRENIEAFGGDPDRITVMAQSGGAINAIMIAHQMPASPLFHQMILMSPPYISTPASLDLRDWATVTEALAKELGTTVAGLRNVPAMDLHNAELRQFQQRSVGTATGRAYRGAVLDGVVLKEWPAFHGLPNLPTVIGCIGMEGASLFSFFDPLTNQPVSPPRPDDTTLRAQIGNRVSALYHESDNAPTADDIIEHYRAAAKAEGRDVDLGIIFKELFGDTGGRHYAVRKAEHAVRGGNDNLYFYQYGLPLNPPNGPPAHATELSIFFGTYLHPFYRSKIGAGELQREVSDAIIESLATFAATGRPASPKLPEWPRFDARAANVMVFGENDNVGVVSPMPKYQQLSILDSLAAMRE